MINIIYVHRVKWSSWPKSQSFLASRASWRTRLWLIGYEGKQTNKKDTMWWNPNSIHTKPLGYSSVLLTHTETQDSIRTLVDGHHINNYKQMQPILAVSFNQRAIHHAPTSLVSYPLTYDTGMRQKGKNINPIMKFIDMNLKSPCTFCHHNVNPCPTIRTPTTLTCILRSGYSILQNEACPFLP